LAELLSVRRALTRYLAAVRKVIALALAIAACSGGDKPAIQTSRSSAPSAASRGPDALLLRVPKKGGVARVTAYPDIDSTMWSSSDAAPALDHALAFDADAGLIAAADTRGFPVWIDLHIGAVTVPGKGKLHGLVSVDGSSIYGVGTDGAIARFTPAGNWVLKPPMAARAVYPQSNGSVLVLAGRGEQTRLWRLRPPEKTIVDSVALPNVATGSGAPLGDWVFLYRPPSRILSLRARTLALGEPLDVKHRVLAIATTPSGDRAYAVLDSAKELAVLDPYQNRIVTRAALPGKARDVRVDPFGRYVLVRAATGDSVWVLSVGTDRVVQTLHTQWRGDLPSVMIDGAIALIDGEDVVFKGAKETRVAGGASDFWYPFVWNGLRPRAASLDQPASFPTDSDSIKAATPAPIVDSTAKPAAPAPADSAKIGFTVSFAVLLDEARARDEASKISVNGQAARVVTGVTAGTAVFRVVLGPYSTREEADRAGRAANHTYTVYAGTP
jgi:hypothetical protein